MASETFRWYAFSANAFLLVLFQVQDCFYRLVFMKCWWSNCCDGFCAENLGQPGEEILESRFV